MVSCQPLEIGLITIIILGDRWKSIDLQKVRLYHPLFLDQA